MFTRLPDFRRDVEARAHAFRLALARPLDMPPPMTFDVYVGSSERARGDFHVVRDEWQRPVILCRFAVKSDGDAPVPHLTPTERAVLSLKMRGMANKEIASSLVISPETVRTHVKSIFRKLGVDTRVKAAMWGRKHLGRGSSEG